MTLALRLAALLAVAFGVLTLSYGGRVLFGEGAAAAGQFVPFVVWFNFLAGFAYVAAGVALWLRWRGAAALALALALLTAGAFAALGVHISGGGAYEARTLVAMSMRTFFWAIIAVLAWKSLQARQKAEP